MVINYADIYDQIQEEIPKQNWYTPDWNASSPHGETSIRIFKNHWTVDQQPGLYIESYGQGEDPEQQPIVMQLVFTDELEERYKKMEELEEDIQQELKPLIGFNMKHENGVFFRKELPSDPLTLIPRFLEELTKLQPIVFKIDQLLERHRTDAESNSNPSSEASKEPASKG